jgi:hypothetical protein
MGKQFVQSANNFTKNKYALVFSNFPNLSEIPDDEVDLTVFSTKVQTVDIPNKTISLLESNYLYERQRHPNNTGAKETQAFTVDWILDDRLMNYALLDAWYKGARYGKTITKKEGREVPLLRDNCIERVDIYALDNANFPRAKFSFHRVFLTGIGNLNLQFGVADVVTFNTTFEYEQFGHTIQGKNADGTWKIEPLVTMAR